MVGGNDVLRSFVHERGAFLGFFPSSNKLNVFHIYNTLVSQISIEILGISVSVMHYIYRTAVIGCLDARWGGTPETLETW